VRVHLYDVKIIKSAVYPFGGLGVKTDLLSKECVPLQIARAEVKLELTEHKVLCGRDE
jgi:hypothetical protein